MNGKTFSILSAMTLAIALAVAGCSTSGDSSNGEGTATSRVTIGTMTKGSVIVNGVHYDDTTATITVDDNAKTAAFLQSGMTVKVKGKVNDDGITGVAEKVEVKNEARGAVEAKGAVDTFTVHGQTVLVDGATIFANATDLAGLGLGDNVEIHGQRDDAGVIHAGRIEKLAAGAVGDEVRGVVANKGVSTFTIGNMSISFGAGTSILPAGASFADGDVVQVHLNGTAATRIEVEHLNEAEFEPAEGQELEVEGFVSGFSGLSTSFKVNDKTVLASSTTVFDGGLKADLANDVKIEAEGHLTNGVLAATKIAFKAAVKIEANAGAAGSSDLLGKTVKTTSKSDLTNLPGGIAGIAAGSGLSIRGFVNIDGSLTATRIDALSNPVQASKTILQGPVKDINTTAHTFTILGITISAASATARPNDDNGTDTLTMPLDGFFGSLAADRTIVKAKGTFSAGALAASEIEIE